MYLPPGRRPGLRRSCPQQLSAAMVEAFKDRLKND